MKKLILVLVVVFFISNVFAIGITPGRTSLDFTPGAEKEVSYTILNNEHKNLKVFVSLQGELNGSVTLYNSLVEFLPSEESKSFKAKIKIPENLKNVPGTHSVSIMALEIPDSGNAIVGAAVAVLSEIVVNVPYPGKYLESDFKIFDAEENSTATFVIPVVNRGKLGIESARAKIDIYGPTNELIESVETDVKSIAFGKADELSSKWRVNVKSGNYLAKISLFFDGETKNFEKQFSVGSQMISIESIFVNNFQLGEIAKLQILIENKFNQELKGVYANLLVYNNDDQVMADVKSSAENINPLSKKELIAYWDTVGVSEGEYSGMLLIKYGEKSTDRNLILKVSEDNLDVFGVGYAIRPKGSAKGVNVTFILIVLVVILILMNLMWFIFFKRMTSKK